MIFVNSKLYFQHISILELVLGSNMGLKMPKNALKIIILIPLQDSYKGMFFGEPGHKTVENIRNNCIFAIFSEKYSKKTHLAT